VCHINKYAQSNDSGGILKQFLLQGPNRFFFTGGKPENDIY